MDAAGVEVAARAAAMLRRRGAAALAGALPAELCAAAAAEARELHAAGAMEAGQVTVEGGRGGLTAAHDAAARSDSVMWLHAHRAERMATRRAGVAAETTGAPAAPAAAASRASGVGCTQEDLLSTLSTSALAVVDGELAAIAEVRPLTHASRRACAYAVRCT